MSSTASTSTTSYKYYLANGAYIEYILSPDSSIIDVIDYITRSYFSAYQCNWSSFPNNIYMRPKFAAALHKELSAQYRLTVNYASLYGGQTIRLQTIAGPVNVEVDPNLIVPIFLGSEEELKDNNFTSLMEKVLCA